RRSRAVRATGLFLPRRHLDPRPAGVQPHGGPARHLGQGPGRENSLTSPAVRVPAHAPRVTWLWQARRASGLGWARDRRGRAGAVGGEGVGRHRAEAWRAWAGAWARPALRWPTGLHKLFGRAAQRLGEWIMIEVAPGRLVPWIAICFVLGIVTYFAIDREPEP